MSSAAKNRRQAIVDDITAAAKLARRDPGEVTLIAVSKTRGAHGPHSPAGRTPPPASAAPAGPGGSAPHAGDHSAPPANGRRPPPARGPAGAEASGCPPPASESSPQAWPARLSANSPR